MSRDNWPEYYPGPRDDLLALGVISLNFSDLERHVRVLFLLIGGFSQSQLMAVFDRMSNDARQATIDQLLSEQDFPDDLEALVRHFLKCYGICAKNRHAIMHSHHHGSHSRIRGTRGIVLRRFSRSGSDQYFFANAERLREVADSIALHSEFGLDVVVAVDKFLSCRKKKRIADFERHPLPVKPPQPKPLDWVSQREPWD